MKGRIDTMSKEKKPERLCPFKKMTDALTDYSDPTKEKTKTVTHELFEPCAGERCMAYCEGDADAGILPYCMLVESYR